MAIALKVIPEYLGKLVRLNEDLNTVQTRELVIKYGSEAVKSSILEAIAKYNPRDDLTGCTELEMVAHNIAGREINNRAYKKLLGNVTPPKQGGYRLVSATKLGENTFENLDDKVASIDVVELLKGYAVDNVSMPNPDQDVVFMTYKKDNDLIVLMYQGLNLEIGVMRPTDLTVAAEKAANE
jgi:hypothetical protein